MQEVKSLTGRMKLKSYFQLLRPKQWIKNLFIFAALMFSKSIDKPPYILISFYAFICFCITSSTVYIFNDLLDIEKDRRHPRKRKRPLAAGVISRREAQILISFMLPAAVVFSFMLNYSFGLIVMAYLINNLLYTLYVKNLVILDVMSIAMGFILRVAGGAVAIGVLISPWLLLCTFLLALFLGFSKRRNELLILQEDAQSHRSILEHYSLDFIDNMLSIVTASTLISYSLYTFFSSDDRYSMVTILFVLYGIFRYQYIIYNKKLGESPEEIVLTDRPLFINIMLWILTSIVILYK
ncbi:MAG: phosphoribose diphosphate--decaprenyl-phosphate phosphoribosyltransferase [Clostridia bacterium BRH_c25]|nr:MAG: phosphoribose diphosphate--decaprenyl-phosphate phosphoribosyltransferase [Clostridia bacterium BRH_c25]